MGGCTRGGIDWGDLAGGDILPESLFSSEKTAILKKCNFFGQACFLHPGNQVLAYHAYIFPSCDIMTSVFA